MRVHAFLSYPQNYICILGSDRNFGSVRGSAGFSRFGSAKKIGGSVWFGFGKNSWFGRFVVCVRKQPKFRFGSGFSWFWPVRFGSAKKSEVRLGSGSAKIFGSVVS